MATHRGRPVNVVKGKQGFQHISGSPTPPTTAPNMTSAIRRPADEARSTSNISTQYAKFEGSHEAEHCRHCGQFSSSDHICPRRAVPPLNGIENIVDRVQYINVPPALSRLTIEGVKAGMALTVALGTGASVPIVALTYLSFKLGKWVIRRAARTHSYRHVNPEAGLLASMAGHSLPETVGEQIEHALKGRLRVVDVNNDGRLMLKRCDGVLFELAPDDDWTSDWLAERTANDELVTGYDIDRNFGALEDRRDVVLDLLEKFGPVRAPLSWLTNKAFDSIHKTRAYRMSSVRGWDKDMMLPIEVGRGLERYLGPGDLLGGVERGPSGLTLRSYTGRRFVITRIPERKAAEAEALEPTSPRLVFDDRG